MAATRTKNDEGHPVTVTSWTIHDSLDLYHVLDWGSGFFAINAAGNVEVRPRSDDERSIDLMELVENLGQRGVRTPLLVRFNDILDSRVRGLNQCFREAIEDLEYRGSYRGVYPIKVNQQRHVVEELIQFGAPEKMGLEAGSKPELLIALALLDTPGALIICNGYKDRAYVETALLAQRLGRTPIIVVDRFHEIELILKTSRELGIRPHLGIRARLSTKGAGRWVESTGDRSKFGLSSMEIVAAVDRLASEDMLDCVELMHFHIGSQITAARAHKDALSEASRIFVGLHEMGAKPSLIDAGGGLGVDYDGSRTNFHSSKNYSMQEYANDVVSFIQEACDAADIPHPDIVTESGRALTAHHSVLIFDILGVNEVLNDSRPNEISDDDPKVLRELLEVWEDTTIEDVQESYHNAQLLKEEAASMFSLGYLDLRGKARVEQLFAKCCDKILGLLRELPEVPEELSDFETGLADTYYGNLSVFQSAPDHWAVKQLFPVLPIHRLDEKPTRRGIIADLTCDSDGKISRFIDQRDVKDVLELHTLNGHPYYLGMFLLGAYQEILGDLHNLFGDTNAVHVNLEDDGTPHFNAIVRGDTLRDALRYVQFDPNRLFEQVRVACELAIRAGKMTDREARAMEQRYRTALDGYTYLVREDYP